LGNQVYYAHSNGQDKSAWQKLVDHLYNTADLAAEFGNDAGISELAYIAGLFHDVGKYSIEFQKRLDGAAHLVDHATAGAREIVSLFQAQPHKVYAELLSYCIAGHHTGLPDYGSKADIAMDGTLLARREKKILKDYSAYKDELDVDSIRFRPVTIKLNRHNPGFSISFLTRMVFSCLVDADWIDTERFVLEGEKPRGQNASISELSNQFSQFLERFSHPKREIDRQRTEILKDCIQNASKEQGFFTLTVPTGGGKTFASMAFALKHAVKHDLKRVIYVIPFTSIIEQNAAKFREALGYLGQQNVLEHHSNFDWEGRHQELDDETNNATKKLKLAAENWDIPIVVTTNVQFFESLFSSKKMAARKLHNLARSVIVFDEVQMLPREYLKPCLLAVQELVQNYRVSAVFCTATQPSLQRFFKEDVQFTELASDPQQLFEFFRRIDVKDLGMQTDEDMSARLNAHPQVLCIVNTRKHAKGLFSRLEEDGSYHLSTLMCPAHRTETLRCIEARLKAGDFCRVVSTQVMEAGIDVDFPVGYRALAGLDSIVQAGGRVNREGRQKSGELFVFSPRTKFIRRTPIFIKQTAAVAESILREHDDPAAVVAIEDYYNRLYGLHDEHGFDVKGIVEYLDRGPNRIDFDFKTAAENFKLIEQNTVSVIIPYCDEACRWIEELKYTDYPFSTMRKLQKYVVNIYEGEFLNLQSTGVIQTIADRFQTLDGSWMRDYYHPMTGLILPERSCGEAIFFD
jgi:CRISPR-associated endonuclease/helicase Cas3